jgi:hypothetical protein
MIRARPASQQVHQSDGAEDLQPGARRGPINLLVGRQRWQTVPMTTTLSTSELRDWARENGFAVGDRGRLPAQVHEAWTEASRRPKARTRRSRTAPEAAAPSRVARKPATGAGPGESQAKDIMALQAQVAVLTDRVGKLERKLAAELMKNKADKKFTGRV